MMGNTYEVLHSDPNVYCQLFLAELQQKSKPSFSSIPGHQYLFLEQLQWLEKQHPPIRPNHVTEVKFPEGKTKHLVTLPETMRLGNELAMAESGDIQRVLALDSQAISITRQIPNRTLRVTSTKDNKPLPRSYVKIYVETTEGEIIFFKDGYTDLRGMLPYESHTRMAPHRIKRYAIFTSHPELGSKILLTK